MSDRRRRNPTGREAAEEIEARLGDLLGTLGDALSAAIGVAERGGDGEQERRWHKEADAGPVRASVDLHLRVGGLDGSVRRQSADRPEQTKSRAPECGVPREPVYDIHEEPGLWWLVADLPGVAPEDLVIGVDAGVLKVTTAGARRYRLRVPLPREHVASSLRHGLVNGILEVTLACGDRRESGA